ncbi:hypothetical protein RIF29_40859 [Crotalaria pallida]|uniref:Uncharacterized protein n=1 Tax=Crotalaria pallida TaxID=3830 RepID=A0AAN9HS28_CROPI
MRQPEVWGHGSIAVFLVIVAILLLAPLFMGSVSPPGIPLILVFPLVIAALITFLIVWGKKLVEHNAIVLNVLLCAIVKIILHGACI